MVLLKVRSQRRVLCALFFLTAGVLRAQTFQESVAQADTLAGRQQYDSARALLETTLHAAESTLEATDTTASFILSKLGFIHFARADYRSAEGAYRRALELRRQAFGENDLHLAQTLANLGKALRGQGRFEEAEFYIGRAVRIRESLQGPSHPDFAAALSSLATIHQAEERFEDAEAEFRRSLAVMEKSYGDTDPRLGNVMNNYAVLLHDLGRYDEAMSLLERVLQVYTVSREPDSLKWAKVYNNMARIHHERGRYELAEPLYLRALQIREKLLGEDHPDVAESLVNLATLQFDDGRASVAESRFRAALAIMEKLWGREHREVAVCLNNLALVLIEQPGREEEAAALLRRALAINEKTYGPHSGRVAETLRGMAALAEQRGDFAAAKRLQSQAYTIRRSDFCERFRSFSERKALQYSVLWSKEAANYLSVLMDSPGGAVTYCREIAAIVLSTKGQVSDAAFDRHAAVSAITLLNQQLIAVSDRLSRLSSRTYDASSYDSLTAEKDRLESELARIQATPANSDAFREITGDEIAGRLPIGSVLVEFMEYSHRINAHTTEPRYVAVILRAEGLMVTVPLGRAADIDSAVAQYRYHFAQRGPLDDAEYPMVSEGIYARVWRPIEAYVGDANCIFLSPDGALSVVSFAGLWDLSGQYLIERHAFQYLASGRDLLRMGQPPLARGAGLLALGDPDFDATAAQRTSRECGPGSRGKRSRASDLQVFDRGGRSGCDALRDLRVARLPQTRLEVEHVVQQWRKISPEPVQSFFDCQASEELFEQESRGKRVIHLATHGYYLSGECGLPQSEVQFAGGREYYVGENPLLLSGLLLAGANLHGEGADSLGAEDGIVSAEEVARRNLQGTDLVILSACETALGKVTAGEGVYGLRRSFQLAGARTVISALWAVDDRFTARLMGQVFSRTAPGYAELLRELQLEILRELRQKHVSDHPFFWAGFVAMGDWAVR